MNPVAVSAAQSPAVGSYFVAPAGGTAPGVLVLHAWWGLTPFLRGFCDRLAAGGLAVLAPDLYHGATAATIEEAKRLRGKLKQETAIHWFFESDRSDAYQAESARLAWDRLLAFLRRHLVQ
jgi:dienelactone hydrolase